MDGTARRLIEALGLEPHPTEGGYFRETWRSATSAGDAALGSGYAGARSLGTAIYYMLTADTFSALHRLPGDEIFHFYLGDPVEMLMLMPDRSSEIVTLGTDVLAGMKPQHVVPGGVWQGAALAPGGRFALLGTTMSPGFDYADYETGDAEALAAAHPDRAERLRALAPG